MLGTDAPVSAFRLAAEPLPEKTVPIVCVPTTAGTGSEMTGISVVSDAAKTKFWFWGAPLEADLALLDPELTVGLPPKFTAMTGMDALVHAIEAATNRNAAPESDVRRLSRRSASSWRISRPPCASRRTSRRAEKCWRRRRSAGSPSTRRARRSPTISAMRSGRLAPVPHGHAVTLAMAATAEWVVEGNREAFARVAEAMGEGADADEVPAAFRRLATDIGLALDTPPRRRA